MKQDLESRLERALRPRSPRLTDQVLDGIIAATSQVLAGEACCEGGELAADAVAVNAADQWARTERSARRDRKRAKGIARRG